MSKRQTTTTSTDTRLLFGPVTDDELRRRTTTTHRKWWTMLRAAADHFADTPPGPALGSSRSLGRDTLWYRQLGEGVGNLAMAWRCSREERYRDAAARNIRFALRLKDWAGDLEQGHLLTGLGLGLDWLWEDLPAGLRKRLVTRLEKQGGAMVAQMRTGEGTGWWHRLYTQNHLWVNANGIAVAAWALRRRAPALRRTVSTWLRDIHRALDITFERLPEDGSFHEMGSYHLYGLRALVMYATGAEWEDGIDRWSHGYLRHAAAFCSHASTPSGRMYSAYGDSERVVWGQASLARLAARYRDGAAQRLAEIRLVRDPADLAPDEEPRCRYFIADRTNETYLGMVWYDVAVKAAPPKQMAALFEDLGLVCGRSGWDARASGFVGKCGPWGGHKIAAQGVEDPTGTSLAHSNPDNLSFFYYCRGQEIIGDADYEMRCRTASHNTIMVEEAGQYGDGVMWPLIYNHWPSVTEYRARQGWTYAACDGSDAYPVESMLKLARRHFIYRGDVLVVADELESFYSNWFRSLLHTYGRLRLREGGATITRGKVKVEVDVIEPSGNYELTTEDRVVIARQGYGHPTEEEARGRRLVVGLKNRKRAERFLVVLRPADVQAAATWEKPDRVCVEVEGERKTFRLSRRPGLRPRTSQVQAATA